jgi:hypothetical protein
MTYYSDYPPPMVFPDTERAHDDAMQRCEGVDYAFCTDYVCESAISISLLGTTWRNRCANRRLDIDKNHSWCIRCPAGYVSLDANESTAFKEDDPTLLSARV